MNKKITIILIAVALIAAGAYFFPSPGGIVETIKEIGSGRVIPNNPNFTDCVTVKGMTECWQIATILANQDQYVWKNNVGKQIFLDYSEAYINGTASSTFKLSVGTTSVATLVFGTGAQNFSSTVYPWGSSIDNYSIVTSTGSKLINSEENQGTNGVSTFPVADGEYVFFLLRSAEKTTGTCVGSNDCENSTSSNKGFTMPVRFHYHYLD